MSQVGINISNAMNDNSNYAITIVTESDFEDYFENQQNIDSLADYKKINNLNELIQGKVSAKNGITGFGIISNDNKKMGNLQLSDDIIKTLLEQSSKAKGKFFWSLNKNSAGYRIYTSAQINTLTTGKNYGIVIEEFNPKLLVDLFRNVNLGNDSEISVIDSKGTIVLNDDINLIGTEYKDKSIIKRIQEVENDSDGDKSASATIAQFKVNYRI